MDQDHRDGRHPHQGQPREGTSPSAKNEPDSDLSRPSHPTPAPTPPEEHHRPSTGAEEADRPLPTRISFLAGPPQYRRLHGRGHAPPPPARSGTHPAPPLCCLSRRDPPLLRSPRRAPAASPSSRAACHTITTAAPETARLRAKMARRGAPPAPAAFDGRAWPPPPTPAAAAAGGT